MKRILINATHNEEIRVALCKNNHLYDFDLENRTREQKKSNIYKGYVTQVKPSLEAVFVEYGAERQGFLSMRDVAPEYLNDGNSQEGNSKKIAKGDELIIQVIKEERGNKGAAISTNISLPGRYLVLMPKNPKGGGISRNISGKVREDMRQIMANLDVPKGMSVILRTNGIGKTCEDLQTDLSELLQIWVDIMEKDRTHSAPCMLYQEVGVVTRAMRDYLRDDIHEIWIDSEHAYNEAANFISNIMPAQMSKLRKYTDYEPMFMRFGIERQIESAYQREVSLPSGGSIVIDQTEALVSIDINSAKSNKGSDIAATAYHTNLEAADEIARQLRLRDMGGLIVIDFIDMAEPQHQKEVEKRLIDATRYDRARIQFSEISKFGLMEMSRQRLRPSLEESTGYICPRCHGNGMIRDVRSLALSIMRAIEQLALKSRSGEVQAEVPTEIAAFLLNEKRESLVYLEQDTGTRITILPHAHLESPNYGLHFNPDGFAPASYDRITDVEEQLVVDRGYNINWQTNQNNDRSNKTSTNHWQKSKNPAPQAEPKNKPSPKPTNNAPVAETPKAVAWLSNLFAPKQEANLSPSLQTTDAAAAIETLVNNGNQSLGTSGSINISTPKKENAKPTPRTNIHKAAPKKDSNQHTQHTHAKEKENPPKKSGTNQPSYAKNKDYKTPHQKRDPNSRREPREAIARTDVLSHDNKNPVQKPSDKIEKTQNKPQNIEQTPQDKKVGAKKEGELVMHVKRPEQESPVKVIYLSLDDKKPQENSDTPKPTNDNDKVQQSQGDQGDEQTPHKAEKTKETTANPLPSIDDNSSDNNTKGNDAKNNNTKDNNPKDTKNTDNATHSSSAAPQIEQAAAKPNDKTTANIITHSICTNSVVSKPTGVPNAQRINELSVLTKRIRNDPRVIKKAMSTPKLGSAGDFIRANLDNAEEYLNKEGFVACFIRALQGNDNFSFANYGYAPLSQSYLATFDKIIQVAGAFAIDCGKTQVAKRVIGERASNDPRGAYINTKTQADLAHAPSADISNTAIALTDNIIATDGHDNKNEGNQTAPTDNRAFAKKADITSDHLNVIRRINRDFNRDLSDEITKITNNTSLDADKPDEGEKDNQNLTKNYKNMIENIAEQLEQLSPPTGLNGLKMVAPKKVKTTTKVAIKIPKKSDMPPKVEIRKKKPKEEQDTQNQPNESEDNHND